MRVLIAIDDSMASEAAINQVISQMKTKEAEIRLVHILDPYPTRLAKQIGSRDTPNFVAAVQKQREIARDLLERVTQILRAAGFSVSASTQEGDVHALIIEEAKAWHADLIVLGSHDRRSIWRFFSGSISEDVTRDAPCSVQVVRVSPWVRRDSILNRHECTSDAA